MNLNYLDHFGFSTKPFTKELGDAELLIAPINISPLGSTKTYLFGGAALGAE